MFQKITQNLHVPKLVIAAIAIATVTVISTSGVASAASNNYYDVPKPTEQRACYTQSGGAGWQALGFSNLDHCLRYVSTQAPTQKADCNHGYWYVFGFNSRGQCTSWVVHHGGSGYDGDPNEWF